MESRQSVSTHSKCHPWFVACAINRALVTAGPTFFAETPQREAMAMDASGARMLQIRLLRLERRLAVQ
jgi:hypothetical protein